MIKPYFTNMNVPHTKEEKEQMIAEAAKAYKMFLEALKVDMSDPNVIDTPTRVAKMYVNELARGRYDEKPIIKSFPNTEKYDEIIFTNCETTSLCSHHNIIFDNKIFMGVISNANDPESRLIGLSKYTRIAEWVANRFNLQEDMTSQIHDEINNLCAGNLGVMVYVIGQHGCVKYRGAKQTNSKFITSKCSGNFRSNQAAREEFFSMVNAVQTHN